MRAPLETFQRPFLSAENTYSSSASEWVCSSLDPNKTEIGTITASEQIAHHTTVRACGLGSLSEVMDVSIHVRIGDFSALLTSALESFCMCNRNRERDC